MSKFFEASGSSSNDDVKEKYGFFASDSGTDSSSEEATSYDQDDYEEQNVESIKAIKKPGFFDISSSEESDEEERKVVKSQSQKLREEIEHSADDVLNLLDQSLFSKLPAIFDSIIRIFPKVTDKSLVDVINDLYKEVDSKLASLDKHELAKLDSKAVITTQQRLKKIAALIESAQSVSVSVVIDIEKKQEKLLGKLPSRKIDLLQFDISKDSLPQLIAILKSSRSRKSSDRPQVLGLISRGISLCKDLKDNVSLCLLLISRALILLDGQVGASSLKEIVSSMYDFAGSFSNNFIDSSDLTGDLDPENTSLYHQQIILSVLSRTRDAFVSFFVSADPHLPDYASTLVESLVFCKCLLSLFEKFSGIFVNGRLTTSMLFLELSLPFANTQFASEASGVLAFVYQKGSVYEGLEAFLYNIVGLCRADKYKHAIELWEESKLSEFVLDANLPAKILASYHRSIAYLGLAAFRSGHIKASYYLLQELCSSGKPKELLGQQTAGASVIHVPYHLHINVELLDAYFSIASLVMEAPQLSFQGIFYVLNVPFEAKKYFNFQCRHFKRLLETHDKSIFVGPPENTREYIVSAAKDFLQDDVQSCIAKLTNLRIWKAQSNAEFILSMLGRKLIQSHGQMKSIDLFISPSSRVDEAPILTEELHALLEGVVYKCPDMARNFLTLLYNNTNYFRSEDFKNFSTAAATSEDQQKG